MSIWPWNTSKAFAVRLPRNRNERSCSSHVSLRHELPLHSCGGNAAWGKWHCAANIIIVHAMPHETIRVPILDERKKRAESTKSPDASNQLKSPTRDITKQQAPHRDLPEPWIEIADSARIESCSNERHTADATQWNQFKVYSTCFVSYCCSNSPRLLFWALMSGPPAAR